MPTKHLRSRAGRLSAAQSCAPAARQPGLERQLLLTAGRVRLRLKLHPTPTAERIWAALPLHSTAETWGDCLHFEIPVESGRDRTARINGAEGEVYFWCEEARVLLTWGPTAISRQSERRLPRPCNVWASLIDDAAALDAVTPGERVTLARA